MTYVDPYWGVRGRSVTLAKSAAIQLPTMSQDRAGEDATESPKKLVEYEINDWLIQCTRSHILHSNCSCYSEANAEKKCSFCIFNKLELPHLPEMVFPDNVLLLKHCNGCILEFNALDALTSVSIGKLILKIACSDSWKETRQETMTGMNEVKPFDWTFSTNYTGTVLGNFVVSSTAERIDMDKLRQKEQILFYEDLILFEDELHDNGVATCSVKIRVMPSSFFILLRFFLRVDNVMLKVNDTRIYHEFGTDYVLREYTSKEAKARDLKVKAHFLLPPHLKFRFVPAAMLTEPNEVAQMLPLVSSSFEKLSFPIQSN
uniref:TIP41-like protein n=1 Tax=Timema genevievae TaxID=629358 RepID=A0A7R9K4M4_TIMGE|nr:unnamed protein product [Timema genevievae]